MKAAVARQRRKLNPVQLVCVFDCITCGDVWDVDYVELDENDEPTKRERARCRKCGLIALRKREGKCGVMYRLPVEEWKAGLSARSLALAEG